MRGALLFTLSAIALLALPGLAAPLSAPSFSTPVKLNPFGAGYEPGIDVDSQGTLYATAHKASVLVEGTRLSSWLWYSDDDGATWREMPSPAQAHDKLFAFEGDLAIDALDRLYYVDTLLADNTISRWSPGPTWDYSLPLQRTGFIDDRPWVAAHGDGIVYYLGNSGIAAGVPGPENAAEGSLERGRYHFYRSEDGGLTWSVGRVVPHSGWCGVEASPLDDVSVYIVCIADAQPATPRCIGSICFDTYLPGKTVFIDESHDRGASFTRTIMGSIVGSNPGFPSITIDRAGNVYAAWADVRASIQSKLAMGRWTPGEGWSTLLVPVEPGVGTISRAWIDSGSDGVVSIAYYGTPALRPDGSSEWRTYVAVTADADAASPTWETTEISGVVTVGNTAPGDFMQNVVGPDDRVHVVFGKDIPAPDALHTLDYTQDIYYAGQLAGPNLS